MAFLSVSVIMLLCTLLSLVKLAYQRDIMIMRSSCADGLCSDCCNDSKCCWRDRKSVLIFTIGLVEEREEEFTFYHHLVERDRQRFMQHSCIWVSSTVVQHISRLIVLLKQCMKLESVKVGVGVLIPREKEYWLKAHPRTCQKTLSPIKLHGKCLKA